VRRVPNINKSSATKPKNERPPGGFKGKFKPAAINCSPESIKEITQKDNAVRSAQELQYIFEMIDATSNDGIIDSDDLTVILRRLKYEPAEGEVKDIIWEVDDDNDDGLTWEEFSNLYKRIRQDKDGYEPRRLYSLIEFLMFDLDADGYVSLDEAVELFYRRYGREVLFKKNGVQGMQKEKKQSQGKMGVAVQPSYQLSFYDYVCNDLSFYAISRQMEDSRKAALQQKVDDERRRQVASLAAAATVIDAAPRDFPMGVQLSSGLGAPANFKPGRRSSVASSQTVADRTDAAAVDVVSPRTILSASALPTVGEDSKSPVSGSQGALSGRSSGRRGSVAPPSARQRGSISFRRDSSAGTGGLTPGSVRRSSSASSGGITPGSGRRGTIDPSLGAISTLEKFVAMQEQAKQRPRGLLLTNVSSPSVSEMTPTAEEEAAARVPIKVITPRQALRKQQDSRFRRGSSLIYTYHGLLDVQPVA
jgi:Ca2+-binding EF-hand superfamily protein